MVREKFNWEKIAEQVEKILYGGCEKNMKIAVSVLGDISETDGTTVRAKRIFEVLKRKFDVVLIHRGNEGQKLTRVLTVNPAKTKLWNLKLMPVVLRSKFDYIYCCNDYYGFLTYFLLSKLRGYKIIFETHSILSEEHKELKNLSIKVKFFQILEKFVIKHADYVITLSENSFKFYEKYNRNIELIPVFVDENMFKINKEIETKKYLRQERKLIGVIGPFDAMLNKQFLDFLYANIDRFDSRIHFYVIGKCDNKIKNERIVYTGYLETIQDYVNVLSSLDAVLIPSKIATLGPLNKIIEPMSCSLPVFTTPKGMVSLYYVKHGKNIFVFEADEMINKVNELIFDDEMMKKVGENARIVVEKYYSKEVNERKLINIIEDLNANN